MSTATCPLAVGAVFGSFGRGSVHRPSAHLRQQPRARPCSIGLSIEDPPVVEIETNVEARHARFQGAGAIVISTRNGTSGPPDRHSENTWWRYRGPTSAISNATIQHEKDRCMRSPSSHRTGRRRQHEGPVVERRLHGERENGSLWKTAGTPSTNRQAHARVDGLADETRNTRRYPSK